jgi:hypothetical protein
MPYTVLYSFSQFLEAINLSGDHRSTANTRRDHVAKLLKNDFEIIEAFSTGSIPRFTAVRGYADLDVMLALHYSNHIKDRTPSRVLQDVRDSLSEYRTRVRKNGQAVTLYYETWPNVDIVPCSRVTDSSGVVSHYNIPDMNRRRWIASKPTAHSRAIADRSSVCGPWFRRIIKMAKWWNHKHSNYLQSYHMEVIALRALAAELDDVPWNVLSYFSKASELIATSLWHDGSQVDAYLSPDDRDEAKRRLGNATSIARQAWYATHGNNDDAKTAIQQWRRLFGDKFPAYG